MNQYLRLLCVFATLQVTIPANGPKSINLAVETQVLLQPEDAHKNMKFIQGAREFLDKLEKAITPRRNALRTDEIESKKPLTTFLYDAAQVILEFHEEEIELFLKVLESEMKTQFYKGSIFRDIVYDPKLQTYTRNKLKEWANADPRQTRAKLRKYITTDMYQNNTFNNLGNFLNGFYGPEQEEKMTEVLGKLRESQNETELANTVRDALDTLVFQHYDRMNYTARAMLAAEINKLSNYFTDNISADNDLKLTFRKFIEVMAAKDIFERAYGKNGTDSILNRLGETKEDLDTSRTDEKDSSEDVTEAELNDTNNKYSTKGESMFKLIDDEEFVKDYDFLTTADQTQFTLDGYEYLHKGDKKNSTQLDTEELGKIDGTDATKNNSELFNKIEQKEASTDEGLHIMFKKLEKDTAKGDSGVLSKIGNDSNVQVILDKAVEISVKGFEASLEDELVKSESDLFGDVGKN